MRTSEDMVVKTKLHPLLLPMPLPMLLLLLLWISDCCRCSSRWDSFDIISQSCGTETTEVCSCWKQWAES